MKMNSAAIPFYEIKIMTKVTWIILENKSFKERNVFVIKCLLSAFAHWVTCFYPPTHQCAMLKCLWDIVLLEMTHQSQRFCLSSAEMSFLDPHCWTRSVPRISNVQGCKTASVSEGQLMAGVWGTSYTCKLTDIQEKSQVPRDLSV